MLECKKMPHRGLQLSGLSIKKDRLVLKTRRDSAEETVMGFIELIPICDEIIRVRFTESESFVEKESDSLLSQKPEAKWTVKEGAQYVTLMTKSLRVEIQRDTCSIVWRKSTGELLVREPEEGGKILDSIEVNKTIYDDDRELVEEQTVDGLKQTVSGGKLVKDRDAYSTSLRLAFGQNEALYGLGQHEEGILNYRHKEQYLYQVNLKVAIPTLISTNGYGIHFDTHSLSTFRGIEEYGEFWTEVADQLDFFFIYGPEFDQIISGIRKLTGDLPMHPRWAYGYVQSKERYETQEELVQIIDRHRAEKVPLDCIVLDWCSWEEGMWGQKSFDASRFPDPTRMMNEIHNRNARLMISIWPNMQQGGENQEEMKKAGFLLADDQTCNSFDPTARKLYWKQVNEGLFQHGIDAWWCDSTEPFNAEWEVPVKPQPWQRLVLNTSETKKYIDPAEINAYSLMHSRGIYEGQRSVTDKKRVVNLTRSAAPSQQRYGTVTWSGDIEARWSRLKKQIAEGLNFTITGNPRWTLDIGAFFVKPGEKWIWDGQYPEGNRDLGYRELYTRWYQFGAFLPMFRSHGTDTSREIWNFGKPGEIFYDTIKSYTELRYRLLPYIYSLSAWEVFRGYTMMRNLAFDFRADSNVHNLVDQYLFGPSIMVCPVSEPMYWATGSVKIEGKAKSRRVYLPEGADWYDFWTEQRYSGGQWLDADAPLEKLPLFVRAGSILPMGSVVQHSGEALNADWEVRVYAGADAEFNVYDDEGDGYGYEDGACAWTRLSWDDKKAVFTVGERNGNYPGMGEVRTYKPRIIGG